jgi:hypothetical protein
VLENLKKCLFCYFLWFFQHIVNFRIFCNPQKINNKFFILLNLLWIFKITSSNGFKFKIWTEYKIHQFKNLTSIKIKFLIIIII